MRKPIGISVVPGKDPPDHHDILYVACDDGAVFAINDDERDWTEMAPIPGSRRETEQEHEDLDEWPLPGFD